MKAHPACVRVVLWPFAVQMRVQGTLIRVANELQLEPPMKTMTLHEAIRKASRIGFKTGASVRFAYNQLLGQAHSFSTATKTIYAVLFGKIMFQADQTGGQWSDRYVENREAVGLPMTVAVKAVPSPEPETQEGFNQGKETTMPETTVPDAAAPAAAPPIEVARAKVALKKVAKKAGKKAAPKKAPKPKAAKKAVKPKAAPAKKTATRPAAEGKLHITDAARVFRGQRLIARNLLKEGMTVQTFFEKCTKAGIDGHGILGKWLNVYKCVKVV